MIFSINYFWQKKILICALLLLNMFSLLHPKNNSSGAKSFGFIIPTYIATEAHLAVLKEGLRRIRLYHNYPIVIINDHSPIDLSNLEKEFKDVTVELSLNKGAGEMNPYLHYYLHKYFDTAIILHDSMHLNKPLENIGLVLDIKFVRHFTNHVIHWSTLTEPKTDYNQKYGIKTHDDLIIHLLKKVLSEKNLPFLDFCLERYPKKRTWVGCYGIQTIITHDFLKELQEKTNILDFTVIATNRRSRCAMESIFALACHYLRDTDYLANSYDGLYFDGINPGKLITENFSKISLNR